MPKVLVCPNCGYFDDGNDKYAILKHATEHNLYEYDFSNDEEILTDSEISNSYCECTKCGNEIDDVEFLADLLVEYEIDNNKVKIIECSFHWENNLDRLIEIFRNKFPDKEIEY